MTALEGELAYVRLAVMEQRAAVLDSAARKTSDGRGHCALAARRGRDQSAGGQCRAARTWTHAALPIARSPNEVRGRRPGRLRAAMDWCRIRPVWIRSSTPSLALALLAGLAVPAPDLAAAGLEAAARKDVTANRLAQLPTLEVGVDWGSELSETLRGFTIGMRVPFRRNQAGRGLALAEQTRAIAEADAARRRVQAEVTEARGAMGAGAGRRAAVVAGGASGGGGERRAEPAGAEGVAGRAFPMCSCFAQSRWRSRSSNSTLRDAHAAWFSLASALGVASRRAGVSRDCNEQHHST
ncbi:MAG: TolC family protein [Gemmatimonadales bacterium]